MQALQHIGAVKATMSSREIADICEARHNDVIVTIERLINEGVLRLGRNTARPYAPDGGGRPTMVYDLTKRDCLIVVSGYSAVLRAKIIDRWMELEAVAPVPGLPRSFAEALRLAADQQDVITAQAEQLAAAAPAVEFVERYADSTGTKGFRQVAKLLQANESQFREFLIEEKIMYRLGGELTPHSQHIDAGRFCVKAGTAPGNGHAYNAARFTPKGVTWVAGEWAKWQLKQRAGEVAHA
ncbi:phage antirepressor KilAC domain-containing protein [Massilia sp. DD77]|uniref:phage antirepressor KilAC domain-containing protein n=1 Tax=Massilia sp. DD77 TaxID=3109349 RepID=UPI003000A4F8